MLGGCWEKFEGTLVDVLLVDDPLVGVVQVCLVGGPRA